MSQTATTRARRIVGPSGAASPGARFILGTRTTAMVRPPTSARWHRPDGSGRFEVPLHRSHCTQATTATGLSARWRGDSLAQEIFSAQARPARYLLGRRSRSRVVVVTVGRSWERGFTIVVGVVVGLTEGGDGEDEGTHQSHHFDSSRGARMKGDGLA